MRSDAFGCYWMHSDAFGHFWKFSEIFEKILGLFGQFRLRGCTFAGFYVKRGVLLGACIIPVSSGFAASFAISRYKETERSEGSGRGADVAPRRPGHRGDRYSRGQV